MYKSSNEITVNVRLLAEELFLDVTKEDIKLGKENKYYSICFLVWKFGQDYIYWNVSVTACSVTCLNHFIL